MRQLAVRGIGREQPTLLISNDLERPAKQLFARYAERMGIENELDAYIGGFHLDALSSGLPLNVDLDTTLTVIAGNLYRTYHPVLIDGGERRRSVEDLVCGMHHSLMGNER